MFALDHPKWSEEGADWPLRAHSDFVSAGGIDWHVQRLGAGPTVLLLHGTAAATHSWAGLAPLLANDFSVVSLDLPGHGFTGRPPSRALSLPVVADAVAALMAGLDVRPEIVIGHSAGGAIAARYAARAPAPPRLLVALNGAFLPFEGPAGFLFPAAAKMLDINPFAAPLFAASARDPKRVARLIEGTGSDISPEALARYAALIGRSGHVAGALSMMANWDLSRIGDDLKAAPQGGVFVAAENDRAVPLKSSETAARLAPGGELVRLPGLGHLAHEEDPEAIAALIRERALRLQIIAP